ncbi:MAG: hypothetical protein Q9218_007714, partial [Villophora microphyllina]
DSSSGYVDGMETSNHSCLSSCCYLSGCLYCDSGLLLIPLLGSSFFYDQALATSTLSHGAETRDQA